MATTLDIVNNQLSQEGASSNPFLRRKMLRQRLQDTTADIAPQEEVTPTQTYNTNTNYEGGKPTLASTYSKLLNNYEAIGGNLSNASSSSSNNIQPNTYDPNAPKANIPKWLPTVFSIGAGLAKQPVIGSIGSASLDIAGGNIRGGTSKLASLLTNLAGGAKVQGLGSIFGTLAGGLVSGDSPEKIGKNLFNSGLGSALSAANPVLGLGYGLARLFGLDVGRGLSGLINPDTNNPSSWQGGFFSPGYETQEGSYISGGNNNYSPYGGSQYTRVDNSSNNNNPTPSLPNTPYNSGNNNSWYSNLGGSNSDDSASDY